MIKGAWTGAARIEAKMASLDRIKWLLWHGNAPDAIDDAECLADDVAGRVRREPLVDAVAKARRHTRRVRHLRRQQWSQIVNYGERFPAGERISTGFVESAINQIVDKPMEKRQSMRWTPRGAHLLLQTRTCVLNSDLDRPHPPLLSRVKVVQSRSPFPRFVMGSIPNAIPLSPTGRLLFDGPAVPYTHPMSHVTLPPELERFATEAITAGRYRDMDELLRAGVGLLRRLEEERRGFVASLKAAEAEADRVGCVSLDQVDAGMREAIHAVAQRSV
jgi:putative addiction module CopG family antidote